MVTEREEAGRVRKRHEGRNTEEDGGDGRSSMRLACRGMLPYRDHARQAAAPQPSSAGGNRPRYASSQGQRSSPSCFSLLPQT